MESELQKHREQLILAFNKIVENGGGTLINDTEYNEADDVIQHGFKVIYEKYGFDRGESAVQTYIHYADLAQQRREHVVANIDTEEYDGGTVRYLYPADEPFDTIIGDGEMYIFNNREIADGFGHVAWGFKDRDGSYYYGSTDKYCNDWKYLNRCPIVLPYNDNGQWARRGTKNQMFEYMRDSPQITYSHYKKIHSNFAYFQGAVRVAIESKNWGFTVVGNNCMDHAHRILLTYGGDKLPWPIYCWTPNIFFDKVKGEAIQL